MINYIVVSGVASLCKSSITDARGANYIEHGGHNDEQTVGWRTDGRRNYLQQWPADSYRYLPDQLINNSYFGTDGDQSHGPEKCVPSSFETQIPVQMAIPLTAPTIEISS